ncbi:Putative Cardiolipin synthetase, Phospholipase D/nuclease superfamily (fragment) [Cupriavidus necator]|uniref:Putative Cardiolipin synthetase, Phospholipase D/nuclease superfamily n=1 Tax=Cupriavidus necator TaxID=106590 RepID=A0A1K0JAK2_CUPNE
MTPTQSASNRFRRPGHGAERRLSCGYGAIPCARESALPETFILFEAEAGQKLHAGLADAGLHSCTFLPQPVWRRAATRGGAQ